MTTQTEKITLIESIIPMPQNFALVSATDEIRNKHNVTIYRFQKDGHFVENGPRIIAIFQKDNLISLKNLTQVPVGPHLITEEAEQLAETIFKKANAKYARGLSFIRIEHQQREFYDETGHLQQFPVLWIKFGHHDGSYNWVTLGANRTIIEMEFDSRWDYFRGRRKTEMWDNDDWVLAHDGNGPQLASPNALA